MADEDEAADTGPPTPTRQPCPSCSTPNPVSEEFCGNCGAELIPSEPNTQMVEAPATTAPMTPAEREEFNLLTLPKTPIIVSSHGLTHIGRVIEYGKDEVNEDAFHVPEPIYYPAHKIAVHVMIVADGMGGEPGGEVFGQMACYDTWLGIRFLLPFFEQQHGFPKLNFWRFIDQQLTNHLQAQVASANTRIRRYAQMKQFKKGECGATIVVAVAVCDLETGRVKVHYYNEGDARCALVVPGNSEDDKFTQLSIDHTISGAPFRFLGKYDHVSGTQNAWEIWLGEHELRSFWMLCYSDGLWNMLSPDQMTQATESATTPESLCDVLVANALKVREPHGKQLGDDKVKPGDDNVTITALHCQISEGVNP